MHPSRITERLRAFPEAQVDEIQARLAPIRVAPWPDLDGCLCVLFTSRSGSTYLARELECACQIGRMREALNPPRLQGVDAASIVADRTMVRNRKDAWFSFKAGGPGVIAAESTGFFDAYIDRTVFILLLRRDIVAQAVSRVKAMQTGQFHSSQSPRARAIYDAAKIAASIALIANGVDHLRLYLEQAKRPWCPAVYEDFREGDFAAVLADCALLGVPRRHSKRPRPYPVERIGDASNEAWSTRFRTEMNSATGERVERYSADVASCQTGATHGLSVCLEGAAPPLPPGSAKPTQSF